MIRCRFLRDDGTCGHDHDDEVREYCVEGPCSDYEELDLVHRQDVLALAGDVFFSDVNGGAHHIHYIDPERVKELPSVKTTERLIAKVVFDGERLQEIVNDALFKITTGLDNVDEVPK